MILGGTYTIALEYQRQSLVLCRVRRNFSLPDSLPERLDSKDLSIQYLFPHCDLTPAPSVSLKMCMSERSRRYRTVVVDRSS
jgi:hypothetical protein